MVIRVRFLAFLLVGLALLLSGCGSQEPAQRTAFMQFLQTRILDKPGMRMPRLTDAERASFGDYASHYAVMTDFNEGMNNVISKPMNDLINKGAIRSVGEVIQRRDDIKLVKDGMGSLRAALDQQQVTADKAHAALKQPGDLKGVYDKAYDRTVTMPANTFKEVFPAVDGTLDQTLKIADYLQKNADKVKISGASVTVNDAATQAELNTLLQELQLRGASLNAAQRKLQAVVRGS